MSELYGRYRAQVVATEFKHGLPMARVRLVPQWQTVAAEDCPLAEYQLPVGTSKEYGSVPLAKVDDLVWIEFVAGDSRYPVIVGGCMSAINGANVPPTYADDAEPPEHKRTSDEPSAPVREDGEHVAFSAFGTYCEIHKGGAFTVTHSTGAAIQVSEDGVLIHGENSAMTTAQELKIIIDAQALIKAKQLTFESEGLMTLKAKLLNIEV